MEQRLRLGASLLVSAALLVMLLAPVHGASVHVRRSVSATSPAGDMNLVKFCHSSTPCGWAVYVPFIRRIDYFMKNTCECPKGKECLRTDDDLSVSAYVYRCRTPPASSESEPAAGESLS